MKGLKKGDEEENVRIDDCVIIEIEGSGEGGKEGVGEVMDEGEPRSGIFCFSDVVGFGVIEEV